MKYLLLSFFGILSACTNPSNTDSKGTFVKINNQKVTKVKLPTRPYKNIKNKNYYFRCTGTRTAICTREYRPVCGVYVTAPKCKENTPCTANLISHQKTYSTGCVACSNKVVHGYFPGKCEREY